MPSILSINVAVVTKKKYHLQLPDIVLQMNLFITNLFILPLKVFLIKIYLYRRYFKPSHLSLLVYRIMANHNSKCQFLDEQLTHAQYKCYK